jgi:hypothetical protein
MSDDGNKKHFTRKSTSVDDNISANFFAVQKKFHREKNVQKTETTVLCHVLFSPHKFVPFMGVNRTHRGQRKLADNLNEIWRHTGAIFRPAA